MDPEASIRPPAVAGLFYPARPADLRRDVERMLGDAPRADSPATIRALLAPHAGYRYSGAIAARAFARARDARPRTVVLVGPSHVEAFDFTSVFDGDAFSTPLGDVPVDHEIARAIASVGGAIRLSRRGHMATPARGEHALEVMLPFLQVLFPGARVVPITMGSQSRAACDALADALRLHTDPQESLLVASSDLSHFHPYDEAVALDSEFCARVAGMDGEAVLDGIARGRCEACGGGPAAAVMMAAARSSPACAANVLARINSGDITGERDSVVGYASATFGDAP